MTLLSSIIHSRLALLKPITNDCLEPFFPPLFIINLERRPDRLERVLPNTMLWPGEVWRYEAIDAHSPDGLDYAQSLDCNLADWSVWQRGIGGYGNRLSHIDLLTSLLKATNYPGFLILEDDVDIPDPAGLAPLARLALASLIAKDADLFVFAGWDYKLKRPLSVQDLFLPRGVWRCQCTLATQCNLYSRSGAQKLVDLSSRYPGIHLDELVASLQVSKDLLCIGRRRNPLRCFGSTSDVDYNGVPAGEG